MDLALYAVKIRAEAMQKASELVPSGMLSVMGRAQAQYKYACLQAKEHCRGLGIQEPVCSVASYLFPDGRVIAGHQQVWRETSRADEAPALDLYFCFCNTVLTSSVLFSGPGFPPAELATATVHEDQTSTGQWCFPHRADGVSN